MTGRTDLPPLPFRGTPGQCVPCGRPAIRTELGWVHVGTDDAAACRAQGPPLFVPHGAPGGHHVAGAVLAASALAALAAVAVAVWCAFTPGEAMAFGLAAAPALYVAVRCGQYRALRSRTETPPPM